MSREGGSWERTGTMWSSLAIFIPYICTEGLSELLRLSEQINCPKVSPLPEGSLVCLPCHLLMIVFFLQRPTNKAVELLIFFGSTERLKNNR